MLAKFTAYFITSSNSILTDAAESIVNILASLFAFYSIYVASQPRDFNHPYGHGKVEFFYGKAGESIFVDPAVCYHYGSRCKEGRLAIFFTFNTSTPYMIIPGLIQNNKNKLFEIGKTLRPDLSVEK